MAARAIAEGEEIVCDYTNLGLLYSSAPSGLWLRVNEVQALACATHEAEAFAASS